MSTTAPVIRHRGDRWWVVLVDGSQLGPYWTEEQAQDAADDVTMPGEPDALDVEEVIRRQGRAFEWRRRS